MRRLLELRSATLGYQRPLLGPVHLSINEGERWAVLGPNGGGKTTLLKSLGGLLPLLAGSRTVEQTPVRPVGYVPQAHRTDPVFPLTAFEVTLQGRIAALGCWKRPGATDQQKALAAMAKVGLGSMAEVPFRSLSGGQRQRVLLARALCVEPSLLFLDEFTSELDPVGSASLLGEVAKLTSEVKVSVVFITHDISAAATYATHVALVDSRNQLFQTGPAPDLLTGERLTRLYGQRMRLDRQPDGRTVVQVESGGVS